MSKKLNFIGRLKKSNIINKLNKTNDFKIYQSIKEEFLKNDPEIMELAWSLAPSEQYIFFPEEFQLTNMSTDNLKFLSTNVQMKVCENDFNFVICASQNIQFQFGIKHPEQIKRLNEDIQIQLALQNNELIEKLSIELQEKIIEKSPNLFHLCSKEGRISILSNADIDFWNNYLKNENINYEEFRQIVDSPFFNRREAKLDHNTLDFLFLNNSKGQRLDELIQNGKVDYFHKEIKKSNLDIQNQVYENRNELLKQHYNSVVNNDSEHYNYYISNFFSQEFIKYKFLEMYGSEKAKEYEELITTIYSKSYFRGKGELLDFFIYNKNTIIDKLPSQQVIQFLNYYLKDKDEQTNMLTEANHYNDFLDIISDAYGKEALMILRERPGLSLLDIDNIEIFSKEILDNFSKEFVNDLLSYQFGGEIFKFTDWCKNPEDLAAFKLYYDRISNKLGSNVVTMKLCISKYEEYQDILKDTIKLNIQDEEQLKKLDALCTWPKNIAHITKVEELENLEEKLHEAISNLQEGDLNDFIDFTTTIGSENVVYNYFNAANETLKELTPNELKTYMLLQEQNSSIITINSLKQAIQAEIPLNNFFLNKYTALNKIKDLEMKKFQSDIVTDRKKIEENIKNNKYDVKRIIVDGVEVIDLGNMPVNFAIHVPDLGDTLGAALTVEAKKSYLTFDSKKGTSTISASPYNEKEKYFPRNGSYVYWDFTDNEIIALMSPPGNDHHDARLAHDRKIIQSYGNSSHSLREYQEISGGTEISFYRRYRNHERMKNSKYGGKIIPDAIIGESINSEIIQLSQGRFGKNIPILCRRGALNTEKQQKQMELEIKEILEQIKQKKIINPTLNNDFDSQIINHHSR